MSPHISLITLDVVHIAEATAFCKKLGFVRSKEASEARGSFLGWRGGACDLEPGLLERGC